MTLASALVAKAEQKWESLRIDNCTEYMKSRSPLTCSLLWDQFHKASRNEHRQQPVSFEALERCLEAA